MRLGQNMLKKDQWEIETKGETIELFTIFFTYRNPSNPFDIFIFSMGLMQDSILKSFMPQKGALL